MKKRRFISDINITPFVDVMLVLVVILLLIAPEMTSQFNVALPSGSHSPMPEKPTFIDIDSKGNVSGLNALDSKEIQTIYIRADKAVEYGKVMDVLNIVKNKGLNAALVTNQKA